METIPNPSSPEAIQKGCTCDTVKNIPAAPTGNWTVMDPKCPLHGGVDNLMRFMDQQKAQGKRRR